MAGAPPKRAALPRINTAPIRDTTINESVEDRLLSAVADVLSVERENIELIDSFTDLGGDPRSAQALRKVCASVGMEVKTKDILGCHTLAELETCITPCAPEPPSLDSLVVAPLQIQSPTRLAPVTMDGHHSRSSSRSTTTSMVEGRSEVEEFFDSEKTVQKSAVVIPRAGMLESKLVAFLTLASIQPSPSAPAASAADVQLIPQSQMLFAGVQVASIREALEKSGITHDLPTVWVVVQRIPVTESGDVDRRKLRTWIQNINEDTYHQILSLDTHEELQTPSTEMEKSLQRLVAKVLPIPQEQVGMNFAFSQLGGDEVAAVQLVARSKVESIYIKLDEVLETYTLGQVAASASQRGGMAHRWSDQENLGGFDLSPMQHLYFQTEMGGDQARRGARDGSYRFNQSMLLKIKRSFTLDDVTAAVEAVVGHHAMLRARFTSNAAGWSQHILPEVQGSYGLNQHMVTRNSEVEDIVERTQMSIDIENGPIFAVDYFQTHDGHQMLYVIAHHLVVDLLSWRVIIQDLDELLQNGSLLSQRSMPFRKWNDLQKKDVQNLDSSLLSAPSAPGDYRYWGLQAAPNTYSDAVEVGFSLSEELTTIMQTACNQVFRTDSADVYLAALLLSFSQTFHDRPVPVVWNQEHGRQAWDADIDISETVGWFTTLCPVSQQVGPSDDFIEVLRQLKDTRRTGPARSSQYFASKFFNMNATDIFTHDWPFEIIFSYAGSLQQLERGNGVLEQLVIPGRTIASRTSDMGSRVGRIALFEVSAMIDRGTASVKFLYNKYSLHQELITTWIQNYEHLLLEAIGRLRYHQQELTLSDLPHLDITYRGLDKLNKDRVAALNLGSVRDIEAVYPVTASQQSILISQGATPETGHIHSIYDFASPTGQRIDVSRICSAWQNVVTKHTALRTIIIESVAETGLYDQVVLRRCSPNMLFIDSQPGDDPIETLNNLPTVTTGFNQPQHRLAVCRTSTKTYIKLDVSEALCDSVSVQVLVADLRRAYATEKPLPEPTGLSYPGYIKYLQSARGNKDTDFWRDRLSNTQACHFPRLATKHEHSQYERAHIMLETTAKQIIDFGRAHKISTEGILRLAWALVLRAFTGTNDVCFGFRTTGREPAANGPNMRGAVGCFSNTLMFTMDVSPYKSLMMGLRAAEDMYTTALPHQHVSVAEIHHALGVRGTERLFNSVLSFTGEAADLNSKFTTRASFEIRNVSITETSQYDVAVSTRFSDNKLVVDIGSSILLESQASGLTHTFGQAVKAIIAGPSGSIGGVDLFADRDYAQIVSWGNEANPSYKVGVLHELVMKMAAQTPDAQAICAWDGELTYRQLLQYVTVLAHHLIECGVGPHVTVPVVLEKTVWAPIIMLAVMRAGGAFVPIDAEELNLLQPIFEQLNAPIAIGCESAAPILNNLFDKVVVVSSAMMEQFQLPDHPASSYVALEDIACIFFTPISSRDIKGLAFTHAAISTALSAQGPAASITSTSRVMQLSSFNVDIALAEVFTTLVAGGCVCIPTSADRVLDYTGVVQRMNVNWSYMTPLLSRKLNVDLLPTLRTICFRTRSLDEDSWMPWAGKKKVLFAYGAPDICPLGISFLEVFGPQQLNRFGRPLAGSFWIVNPEDHRRLMPIGAIGELVIEGPTLGCDFVRGHIEPTHYNSADFHDGRKTKYFKTGHRVRYTENGCMEIVSSKREDLTISGKTIVLAEIEQHVRRCLGHGVDVMVEAIAFKGSKSVPVLAAFVELGALFEGSEDLSQLSAATKERLFIARKLVETGLRNSVPAYKLPTIFIPVRHLPVTPSLKVNRRKLQKRIHGLSREQMMALSVVPNPDEVQTVGLKPLPLTETEERMRAIWAKVLNTDAALIGTADGFIRSGGDEVLAAELVTTCRSEGIAVSINEVLRNASLTELCRCMTTVEFSVQNSARSSPALPVTASPPLNSTELTVVVAPISETLIEKVLAPKVAVDRKLIKDVAEASALQTRYIESGMLRGRANINYFIFNFTGFVDSKALEDACQMLATIHPILRTAFVPHNRRVYQIVLKSFNVEFKRHPSPSFRLASLTEKLIRKDQASPVAFSVPMTKFMYLDGGKQSTLVLRLSKAQYDDMSIALLVKDLKRLYDGSQNPPRRPSYCDFIRSAQMANNHGAEDYWKALLDGASMTQVVAHDKPYPLTTSVRTVTQQIPIGSLSNMGITFETVLKAAWAMVLATLSGSNDVVFGELIEGRHVRLGNGQPVAGVLGPTNNTVPVRICFPQSPLSPLDLLQAVHAQRISGIPFENLGFLDMVAKCTSWPYWTRFSTVVKHQYEDTVVGPSDPKMFHLGSATCKFSVQESRAQDIPDMLVHSMIRGTAKVELGLTFCEHRVPVSFAEETLRMLCDSVNLLTSMSIMQPILPTGLQYASMQKQIPLPQAPGHTGGASEAAARSISAADTVAIQTVISTAWANVLEPTALGVPDEHRHTAAFFDLWGSLIPAAQLASFLSKELPRLGLAGVDPASLHISMEDIVEYPTMSKQFDLVARKMMSGGGRTTPTTTPRSASVPASPGGGVGGGGAPPVVTIITSPTSARHRIGQSIRRLASSSRLGGNSNLSPTTPTPTPRSAFSHDVSPMTPVPKDPPVLAPVAPLSPLAEEPSGASGAESMTEGSSAASGDDEPYGTYSPAKASSVILPGVVQVSPLSPENVKTAAATAAAATAAAVTSPTKGGRKKGSPFFGGVRVAVV